MHTNIEDKCFKNCKLKRNSYREVKANLFDVSHIEKLKSIETLKLKDQSKLSERT